ncbi:MAG: alpha/beta fold hydrolase [Aggregatilineales bacterium]
MNNLRRSYGLIFSIVILFALSINISGQDSTPEPETPIREPNLVVEIEATDGVTLTGDYYLPHDGDAPAVLLLHELYTSRASWRWMIEPLLANGFRVLTVDLRGYGSLRRTGLNWRQTGVDAQSWLSWLYAQPGTRLNSVFVLGSSMGANLALNACADAEHCAGVVAMSAGLNYFGVTTWDALRSGRPTLLVYADRDSIPRRDMPRIRELIAEVGAEGTVTELVYEGRAHGMILLDTEEDIIPQMIGWMRSRAG